MCPDVPRRTVQIRYNGQHWCAVRCCCSAQHSFNGTADVFEVLAPNQPPCDVPEPCLLPTTHLLLLPASSPSAPPTQWVPHSCYPPLQAPPLHPHPYWWACCPPTPHKHTHLQLPPASSVLLLSPSRCHTGALLPLDLLLCTHIHTGGPTALPPLPAPTPSCLTPTTHLLLPPASSVSCSSQPVGATLMLSSPSTSSSAPTSVLFALLPLRPLPRPRPRPPPRPPLPLPPPGGPAGASLGLWMACEQVQQHARVFVD